MWELCLATKCCETAGFTRVLRNEEVKRISLNEYILNAVARLLHIPVTEETVSINRDSDAVT
jgi:hypothetical protein